MIETKGIQVVNRNFSFGRFIKYFLALLLLAVVLIYCWNRVQRFMGEGAAEAGKQVNNNGVVTPNTYTSNSLSTTAKKNEVSALSSSSGVRDYNAIPSHGRYQKTLLQLNESTDLGEQDELSRLSRLCKGGVLNMRSFESHWDTRRQVYVASAPDKKSIVWNAQAPARAVAQLQESCQLLNSPPLQDDQRFSKDSNRRSAAYYNLIAATMTLADIQTNEGQGFLRVMIREGLYDHLERVLSQNLSFDRVYADASLIQSKFAPLMLDQTMLVLTLCRLGQDCGEGSIAANKLCATAAVCGGSAEDAILRDAYQLGFDVNLISKHVNEIIAKLQAGNFEDLKPKESFLQRLKRMLQSLGLGGG